MSSKNSIPNAMHAVIAFVTPHKRKQGTSSTNFNKFTRQIAKLILLVLLTECPNSGIVTQL